MVIAVTIFFYSRLIIIMKRIYTPLVLILFVIMIPAADPVDTVATLIGQGNAHELSIYFAQNVEMTIMDVENVYTKTQAEIVVDKFFSQNKPRTVKILHKINSNPNYRFVVLVLNTEKGIFRVSYTMKDAGGSLALIELRIEPEKTK